MLEAANQGMWKLSGAYLAWLRGIQDVVDVGRGWLLGHSLPKLWKGLEFERREDESDKEYTDRLDDLKLANFPLIVRHVDVRNTWPTFTLKRELDQVVEIREMTARQVEKAYGSKFGREKDTDKVKVIVYADHDEMRTVIAKHGGVMGVGSTSAEDALPPWKHELGMNPYILMEAPPLPDNDEGVVWEGSIAPLRYLVPEMDGALTDWRHNTKRSTHSNMVLNLDLEARKEGKSDTPNADLIKIGPDGIVYLDKDEKISDYAGSQTNPDIPGVIAAMRSFTQEGAIRPALLGILEQAGDSGVRYNTGAQLAQKQFGPALDYFSVAAENVTHHLFASIVSFSETFKEIGLEDDKIPIYFVDSDGISQRKKLSSSDVKGWSDRAQAKLELAIPLQENAEIMTARLAADPVGGVMSLETAMERFAHIANPLEEIRKRDLDKIRAALVEQRVQAAQQIAQQIASTPANADILAQDFAAQPDTVKQGIQIAAQAQGQNVPEARSAANTVRTGRGQAPSQTQATGGVPVA